MHTQLYRYLREAVAAGDLRRADIAEWPLFREARNDPRFSEKLDEALRGLPGLPAAGQSPTPQPPESGVPPAEPAGGDR